MRYFKWLVVLAGVFVLMLPFVNSFAADKAKDDVNLLADFEDIEEVKTMFYLDGGGEMEASKKNVTQGKASLKATIPAPDKEKGTWPGLISDGSNFSNTLPADWSMYKYARIDVFLESPTGVTFIWKLWSGRDKDKKSFFIEAKVVKGKNTITIPLKTAGGKVDLTNLVYTKWIPAAAEESAVVYFDNFRLEK